jgi:hypothetical protein
MKLAPPAWVPALVAGVEWARGRAQESRQVGL